MLTYTLMVGSQVLTDHGLHGVPAQTTVRQFLILAAENGSRNIFALPEKTDESGSSSGLTAATKKRAKRSAEADETDNEGETRDLYEDQDFDLFAEHGKAPVGKGKLF